MGHWSAFGAEHEDAHDATVTAEEHELHCHGGVAKCAGSESMVGTSWAGERSESLSLTSPDFQVETVGTPAPVDGELARVLRPPRVA